MSHPDRRIAVLGVADEKSIAWATAKRLAETGSRVSVGCEPRRVPAVSQLIEDHGDPRIELAGGCDVRDEVSVHDFFEGFDSSIDGVVHSIAFAPRDALALPLVEVSYESFSTTLEVSTYSLIRVVRCALPLLGKSSSVVTLSYLGGTRVVQGYRTMGVAKAGLEQVVRDLGGSLGRRGVRVNAVSAGPLDTRAANGVPGAEVGRRWVANSAPLGRNVSVEEVANAVCFLLSPEASGLTCQVLVVDAGYSALGAPFALDRILLEPEPFASQEPR